MSNREVQALSSSFLTDGKRGMDKESSRNTAKAALTARLRKLFLDQPAATPSGRLRLVNHDPPIYTVPHFLSARELDHLDDLITARRAAFKHSHTDASDGKYVGEERTSISLPLPKSADATIRAIESRAADLVGLPADHVEPLQVVHYSNGARFDMHHDVAPITVHGETDEPPEGSGAEAIADVPNDGIRDARTARAAAGTSQDELPPGLTVDDVTVERQDGPRRLITLFVYLNTLPDGIGHTEFPLLRKDDGTSFSVRPRSGTALVFCNVDANGHPDPRLCHRACPVPEGHVKFGVG
jgi:hypothetical protein